MTDDVNGQVPQNPGTTDLFAIELPDVLHALRRRAWLIAACTALVAGTFYVASSRQPKVYTATAKLVIDPVLPKVLDDGFDVSGTGVTTEATFYNTQYEIMRSRAVIRAAISKLKLDEDNGFLEAYGIGATGEARLRAIESVLSTKLEIVPEHQSRIVGITVESFDPDRAARIANALAQVYIDQSLEGRLSDTQSASKWLDERVEEFGKRLNTAEQNLEDFKRAKMLISVSLEDRRNMTASRLTAVNDRLNDIRARLIQLTAERDTVRQVAGTSGAADGLLSAPRIARNPVIQTLLASQVELEREQAKLSSRYGPLHPNMEAVNKQLEKILDQLQQEVKRTTATLDNEIAELKAAESLLDREVAAEVQAAMDLNTLAIEYNRLNRDLGTNEKTYGTLLKRQTEADLSGLLKSNFVRWLETAEPNLRPIRPSIGVNAVLGAFLGLLLGLALVITAVLIDTTVHSQEDVETRLRLPFLGLLPAIDDAARASKTKEGEPVVQRARDLYIVENPKSRVAECARSLRTNLLFLGAHKQLRRVLVTSAGPSEGKSTTVIALGSTMALAGNRVLLVDTDFRRPRLHRTFGVSNEEGLTSVLLGTTSLTAVIKSTDVRGLDILPCGPLPPNPSELMHTEQFLKLLDELSQRYDRILLDSPPVNVVTDATILSQIVDGSILVIKASKTTKDAARRAARQLYDIRANLLGVVLNDVDLQEEGYYRRQSYSYYHYSSGYGEDADTQVKAS